LFLKKTSTVNVQRLSYNIYQDVGHAEINTISALIDSGSIAAGTTKLIFRNNTSSSFQFSNIVADGTSNSISVSDATFIGELTSGTRISLGSPGGGTLRSGQDESYLSVNSGSANFSGIKLKYAKGHLELSITEGSLSVALGESHLAFSNANYIEFGYAKVIVRLSCATAENPDTCIPASWGPSGTYISAAIPEFSAALTRGQFSLSAENKVTLLDEGHMTASNLQIDTRRRGNLITSGVAELKLSITTQSFALDASTSLDARKLTLTSADLRFIDGEAYPTGHMKLSGDVRGATVSTGSNVPPTTMPLIEGSVPDDAPILLEREPKDTLRVLDGSLTGTINVGFGQNGDRSSGTAKFEVDKIHYYRGQGNAVVNMHDFQFSFSITTPMKDDSFNGPLGVQGDYHIHAMTIPVRLLEPLRFPQAQFSWEKGRWSLDKQTIPVKIVASVPGGPKGSHQLKIVDADVHDVLHLCSAEAYSVGKDYVFSGQVDYELSSDRQFLSIGNFSMSDKLEVDPDDASCKRVAFVMCSIAGNFVGEGAPLPAFHEVSTLGAGLLCDKKIDNLVDSKTADFQSDVSQKVRSFQFQIGR
jgi:hypothetical protein